MIEFGEYQHKEFMEYLNGLLKSQENSNKPFACNQLFILPEDVVYGNPGVKLEKGTLVCRFGAGEGIGRVECRVNSLLKVNDSGNLEFRCDQTGSEFQVELKSFKGRNPFDDTDIHL